MPLRSLSSPVLKWPDRAAVHEALLGWAKRSASEHRELLLAGYYGSYARGDWGVGSDVDIIVVVRASPEPWIQRSVHWDTLSLPVPADLLVYTAEEWSRLDPASRFGRMLAEEAVWLHVAPGASSLRPQRT